MNDRVVSATTLQNDSPDLLLRNFSPTTRPVSKVLVGIFIGSFSNADTDNSVKEEVINHWAVSAYIIGIESSAASTDGCSAKSAPVNEVIANL